MFNICCYPQRKCNFLIGPHGGAYVNLIFYLLPACSTSFHEAFLFGLSFIVKKSIRIAILIFYYEIFTCAVFASSSLLQVKHFVICLSPCCCDLGCELVRVVSPFISGIRAYLHQVWCQSVPSSVVSKQEFLSVRTNH